MPQDNQSGATANAFGRSAAEIVAREIGATLEGRTSNKARFDQKIVVIKCAKLRNNNIGVTFKMQGAVHEIVAAFEVTSGLFEVFTLPINIFIDHQRQSKSGGEGAHQVGQVSKAVFLKHGKFIKSVSIPASAA
jgi:hypothetical protein